MTVKHYKPIPIRSCSASLLFAPSFLFASFHLPNVTHKLKQTQAALVLVPLLNADIPDGACLQNGRDCTPRHFLGGARSWPPKALKFTLLIVGLWFGLFMPIEITQVPIIFALVSPVPIFYSKSDVSGETKA